MEKLHCIPTKEKTFNNRNGPGQVYQMLQEVNGTLLAGSESRRMNTKARRKTKRKKPIRQIGDDVASLQSLWKGPVEDGITFSLLSKFLVCRERFRLKVIEGIKEKEDFNLPLQFGSLWHEAEEAHAGGKDFMPALRKYTSKLRGEYANAEDNINRCFQIAKHTFPLYVNYWKRHQDERGRVPILEEESFRVPYQLPSGRMVVLRGKFDCVFRVKNSIWLQENKTKGKIDEEGIQKTLDQNLQTILYQIALRSCFGIYKLMGVGFQGFRLGDTTNVIELNPKLKIKGVIYNVIRRPLSDNYAIKQRMGRLVNVKDKKGKTIKGKDGKPKKKRVGAETESQFYKRMATDIKKDPGHSFFRWKVLLTNKDIETFKRKTFDPILEQLLDWWDWVSPVGPNQPLPDPWRIPDEDELPGDVPYDAVRPPAKGVPGGGIHWQTPWGVYNNMFGGFRGDFFDLLTTGRKTNIIPAKTLFPELSP